MNIPTSNQIVGDRGFDQLIEAVPQLVLKLDLQGHIVWVNQRTIRYVQPPKEQAYNVDWVLAAVHPDDLERVKQFNANALFNCQNEISADHRMRRFDGEYRWFSASVGMVSDKDGNPSYFLKTLTDIHDRKMSEERIRVEQRLESIGQLIGGTAHDFNNLFAVMVGNLELLTSRITNPEASRQALNQQLQVVMSAAQRGVGLVKSMLALASKQPLLPIEMDLVKFAERLAPLLRHAVGKRVGVALQLPCAPVHIQVDEAGLEAVLLNLFINARDAMPQGGEIVLGVDATDGQALLFVKDNGLGMPEAVRARATEPFFTTKEPGRGTGLGLSMVAGFVRQSGGSMQIDSTEGAGTRVEIALPVLRMRAATPAAQTAPAKPEFMLPSGPYRILVVDDEPEIASLARTWLKEDGHTVVLAGSAADALTLLSVRHFDIMISDIVMPGALDGIGLADRAQALYPCLKILLMSGYSLQMASTRAELPWPLLVKPFRKAGFNAALLNAFGDSGFQTQHVAGGMNLGWRLCAD